MFSTQKILQWIIITLKGLVNRHQRLKNGHWEKESCYDAIWFFGFPILFTECILHFSFWRYQTLCGINFLSTLLPLCPHLMVYNTAVVAFVWQALIGLNSVRDSHNWLSWDEKAVGMSINDFKHITLINPGLDIPCFNHRGTALLFTLYLHWIVSFQHFK